MTGVYGSELTIAYYEFLDAGMTVDIASIEGGEIPFEPVSLRWPLATHADKRYLNDADAQNKTRTRSVSKTWISSTTTSSGWQVAGVQPTTWVQRGTWREDFRGL